MDFCALFAAKGKRDKWISHTKDKQKLGMKTGMVFSPRSVPRRYKTEKLVRNRLEI
jgi:hypothetical protein